MDNQQDGFVKGRVKSLKFAVKGVWLLITTEHNGFPEYSLRETGMRPELQCFLSDWWRYGYLVQRRSRPCTSDNFYCIPRLF